MDGVRSGLPVEATIERVPQFESIEDLVDYFSDDLLQIGDNWRQIKDKIDGYLTSEEIIEALKTLDQDDTSDFAGARTLQRQNEKNLEKNLNASVTLATTLANLDGAGKLQATDGYGAIESIFASKKDIDDDDKLIWLVTSEVYENLKPIYGEIYSKTFKILDVLAESLNSDDNLIGDLVEWLEQESISPTRQQDVLLKILATDIEDRGGVIRSYISFMEDRSDRLFKREFLLTSLDAKSESSSEQWINLIKEVTGMDDAELADKLLENYDDWPEEFKAEHIKFSKARLKGLSGNIRILLDGHHTKMRKFLTMDDLNSLANRLTNHKKSFAKAKKRKRGRVTGTDQTADLIDTKSEEEASVLPIYSLKETGNGSYEVAVMSEKLLDTLAEDYASDYPHDSKLKSQVLKMLEVIRKNPLSHGSKSIADYTASVLGKKIRFRRFSPQDEVGFSNTSTESRKTRIVYLLADVDGKKVIALDGIYSHKDFDRKYAESPHS